MSRQPDQDRGMVTTEIAVGTLAVLTLAAMLAWLVAAVGLQLRCMDTAGEVARQAARGDDNAVRQARADAPSGATVDLRRGGGVVMVTVTAQHRFVPRLPAVPVSAAATVILEPGE